MAQFFYKPHQAWSADFIPFYAKGQYYLYYLKDYRNHEDCGEGTPWCLIRTSDFVHFEDLGTVLPRGTVDEQDLYVFTGSVIEALGQYHIFYTGHNPHFRAQNKPEQAVMHAVSDDLIAWRKVPEDTFFAPAGGYEPHDWRDPFVYYNPEEDCFDMLLAARHDHGPSRRRGLTATARSKDLKQWAVVEPMWDPGLYFTHECPDYFTMGEYEYLIYSEFTSSNATRYVMRKRGETQWREPADDRLDTRAWYAAKTASDSEKRYSFGWISTRANGDDQGAWQWGGCLCVHEVKQRADGTLYAREPESVRAAFPAECVREKDIVLNAPGGYAQYDLGPIPDTCRIEIRFRAEPDTRSFSLWMHGDELLEKGHEIRIEADKARIVADCWPRPGDAPHQMAMERPIAWRDGSHMLTLIKDGTALVAYLDGEVAMSMRSYRRNEGRCGVSVQSGRVTVEEICVMGQ